MSRRYCLVSPCRNEAKFMRTTLDTVIAQSVQPSLWVIVDDGSTDGTAAILEEYAQAHQWIRVIRRADRGRRVLGSGVIEAFDEGWASVNQDAFDYVAKLDMDLRLPPRYFELLMQRMEEQPRLGTASGKAWFATPRGPVSEKLGDENSAGMVKFYRVECLRDIGGFVRALMWDGIDGHRCRMRGWIAASWDDPELRFEHLRPMGTSDRSWWVGRVRHGTGQHFMGTGAVYLLASALFRATRPPRVVGGVAILWGYWRGVIRRTPRYPDREFRRFLRRYQRMCLLHGKAAATDRVQRERAVLWESRWT